MKKTGRYEILLVGGGTGGHIFPLIALAEELKERKVSFAYVGAKHGKEAQIVPGLGYPFLGIEAGKWRRYLTLGSVVNNFLDIFRVFIGFAQSFRILLATRAATVMSKGGFVALPMAVAAKLLGRRLIIHESDTVMGLTNRITTHLADKILTAFDVSVFPFADKRFIHVGIPVRKALRQAAHLRPPKKPWSVVLIIAGLQGSAAINNYIKPILGELLERYDVIHSTGEKEIEEFTSFRSSLPAKLQGHYRPYAFIDRELSYYYQLADIIIGRASATTIVEASLFSKPMYLIPLPTSAGNHQLINARTLEKKGAVMVREQHQLNPELLRQDIIGLIESPEKKSDLGKKLHSYFDEEKTVDRVVELLTGGKNG